MKEKKRRKIKKNKENEEWDEKKEKLFEELCWDDYDEEYCYDVVARFDDSDWDDGIPDEIRYM